MHEYDGETYEDDDVSGGESQNVGARGSTGACGFDGLLSLDDGVEAISGEGKVILSVLLGVSGWRCNHDRSITSLPSPGNPTNA